ncbi:MAG TPA: hypothetical protein VGT61_04450 [Thermomicrobiales bacterium]|nr:hypothetical protein [Thermomicrobiales bacterium]
MDNGPRGPLIGLASAIALTALTIFLFYYRGGDEHYFVDYTTANWIFILELNAFEIGLVGLALTLATYSAIGLLSFFLDGARVHVGRQSARLTDGVTVALAAFSIATAACAVVFALAVVFDWGREITGISIGLGFIFAALVLACFKIGFLGEEGRFDEREDGIPW